MPKFSIIIPAHNSAEYIHKALYSIKCQTFKDYEVIVVCDACTDGTATVVHNYGFTPHVVNYHADGLARNYGLEHACGDYILFMDDDDWWLHEYVLDQLNAVIDRYPDVDILCFSFIFKGVGYAMPKGLLYQSDFSIRNDRTWYWIAVWSKCWKRSGIGNTRFSSNTDGSADVKFHYEMMEKKLKILEWDMPMYYYNYMRKGSISELNARK